MVGAFSHKLVPLRRTGPRRGEITETFTFHSAIVGLVTVEVGFDTDYASVPRGLWNLYPPDGAYTEAAVIHDALYWHQATAEHGGKPVTRAQADAVFLEAMKALGIGWVTRSILYRAVRIGGGKAWDQNARDNPAIEDPATTSHIKRHFHKLRK